MEHLEAHPKEIKKSYGLPFYWTCKFLKKESAKNVSLFYAFYRYSMEIGRGSEKSAVQKLEQMERELESPTHTFMVRLKESMASLGVKKEFAYDVIRCAKFDASKNHVQDHEELINYCKDSAGALGAMLAPALGAKSAKISPRATDLGIGAGLLRMCSSILPDAQSGRVFLPKRELTIMRLEDNELSLKGDTPVELKKIVARYLDLAEAYLERARSGLAYLPLRARIGMLIAIKGCQEMAAKIKRHDFEVLEGDIRLSSLNKFMLTYKTFLDIFRPSFWLPMPRSNGPLKRAVTAR